MKLAIFGGTLSLFLLLYACGSDPDTKEQTATGEGILTVDIDHATIADTLYLSDYFSSFTIVPLESTPQSLLSDMLNIVVYKDKIYVLDSRIAKRVFLFAHDGTFIKRIGDLGKGPGEYVDPRNIWINRSLDELLVYDDALRRIIRFNLKGEYTGFVQLGKRLHGDYIASIDSSIFLQNPRDRYLFTAVDFKGRIVTRLFEQGEKKMPYNLGASPFAQTVDDQIIFCQPHLPILYKTGNGRIDPYIQIVTENFINEEDFDKLRDMNPIEGANYERHWGVSAYVETDSIFCFRMLTQPQGVVYDKVQKAFKVGNNLIDDMVLGGHAFFDAYTARSVITLIRPTYMGDGLRGQIENGKIKLGEVEKEKVLKGLDVGNPLLVFYNE